MAASSITLLRTMEWAKKLSFNRRTNLGDFQEPAMTNANTVMQTVVGAPFAWYWNRVVTGFITRTGVQDYTVVNWLASTAFSAGVFTVDDTGNCQLLTVGGTSGVSAPSWNHTKGGTTSDNSMTWTNQGNIDTPVSQAYKFGWIETASVQDASPKWWQMESEGVLGLDSTEARPRYIAAQATDTNGNITFRMMPTPDQAYPVAVTLQQPPSLFTQVSQTWNPIPDQYSHIYNWGFLSMAYLFADDSRFGATNQKFVTQLLAASEGLTQTEVNIFLNNWEAITGAPVTNATKMQQGTQARGV